MAKDTCVSTHHIDDTRRRDLQVYYDKGGWNFWDYTGQPRGIWFAVSLYKVEGGITSWSTGQRGDFKTCVIELERYKPSALKTVRARVRAHADWIHRRLADPTPEAIAEVVAVVRGAKSAPGAREAA